MSSRHARRISTPLPYLGKLTLSAGVITDVTRLAGVEGDGATYPASRAGVWPAATNLCTNGNATTNTTGWGTSGGTVSRITTDHFFGSTCFEFAPNALNDISTFSKLVSGSTTYTISFWFKSPDPDIGFLVEEYDSGDGYLTGVYPTLVCAANERTYATVTFTTNASTAYIVFGPQATESTGAIKFGGVQLETGSIATPYIETDGGTASRSAATIAVPASLMSATQMWVAIRYRTGDASTTAWGTPDPRLFWWGINDSRITLYRIAADTLSIMSDNGTNYQCDTAMTYALGDDVLAIGRVTSGGISVAAKGAAFATPTARADIPTIAANSAGLGYKPDTGLGQMQGSIYWAAVGKGTLTDADSALFNSWGNNDPLPHMFPRSAQLTFLARFNGDGTAYRYV